MPAHPNAILARLSEQDFSRVELHLSVMHLQHAQEVGQPHQPLSHAYFPHTAILSSVVDLPAGGAIETGVIGHDGVFGASQALGAAVSLNRVSAQVPGEASTIPIPKLRELVNEMEPFRKLLISYEQFYFAMAQQTAACNAVHEVKQRLCKWLLRMNGLTDSDLPLTQEFLAYMMGVRRSTVSDAAQELQKAGVIEYKRGNIHVVDRANLEHWACECDSEIARHHRRIFDPAPSDEL